MRIVRAALGRLLPPGSLRRGVAVLAGGTMLAQLLLVAATPVLTRLYDPEQFGTLGVYASLVSLVSVIAVLKYELAITLPEDDDDALALVRLGLVILTATAIVAAALAYLLGDSIETWTNTPDLADYLLILPLGVWGAGAFAILTQLATRFRAFPALARAVVAKGALQAGSQVGLGAAGAGTLGLIVGNTIGRIGGSGRLALLTLRDRFDRLVGMSWARSRAVARRYRRFPLISTWGGLLNSGGQQAPVVLLAIEYGPAVTGWYVLATRILSLPVRLLGDSIGQVYLSEAAPLARSDPGALGHLYRRTAQKLALLGVLPAVVFGLVGPFLFSLVFGADWESAGVYARWLAIALVPTLISSSLDVTLDVLERQDWATAWEALRLVLVVASILVPAALGWSAVGAIISLSAASATTYLVMLGMILAAIGRAPSLPREA